MRGFLLLLILASPYVFVALLSLSPTTGMDFYQDPGQPSLKWWSSLHSDPSWPKAFGTSAYIALVSSIVGLLVVTPVACFARLQQSAFLHQLLRASLVSFLVPPVVMAVNLYGIFELTGLFDTVPGLVVAHTSITIPIAAFVLQRRMAEESCAEYYVAKSLGASTGVACATWLSSTHRASILATFGACFMASLSEATLSVFLADTRVVTISRKIIASIAQDIDPAGFAAMTVWVLIVLLVIALGSRTTKTG